MKKLESLLCGVCLMLALGCQQKSDGWTDSPPVSEASSTVSTPVDVAPADGAAAAKEVTLAVKSWAEVQEWAKSQTGKVVVVDLWSTSCPPCIAELPNFVALQDKYGDKIACASLSLDFISSKGEPSQELQDQVLAVLKKLKVSTTNFLSSQSDEKVTTEIGVAAIPVAFVYDREGKLHKMFTNDDGEYGKEGYTYQEHIYPVVEELVGQGE